MRGRAHVEVQIEVQIKEHVMLQIKVQIEVQIKVQIRMQVQVQKEEQDVQHLERKRQSAPDCPLPRRVEHQNRQQLRSPRHPMSPPPSPR